MSSSDTLRRARSSRTAVGLALVAGAVAVLLDGAGTRAAAPRFYPDDPIQVDNDRQFDASGAAPVDGSNTWDFVEHTFLGRGDRNAVRAMNVNTMDEVPDSSWFTNRIGRTPLSPAEIARGPNTLEAVNIDGWPIIEGKSQGVTPGYRVVDPSGRRYQIKFDPPGNPEMGSGAEVIGAALYHAIGYNVVEGYIVEVDPERIVIDPKATTVDMTGRKKQMTKDDVRLLLRRAARQPNGRYRAIASRYAEGKYLGYFKYYGTRSDDPNDIFPHEHRRELRGNRVFAAWLNHDDSRALNSLDMLQGPEGRRFVRHYMFDFGSIMGSGSTKPQAPRAGNEYMLEWKPSLLTLATLGLYVRPWITIDYPKVAKSIGRFESARFEPEQWKPEYPNPAFDNMRADDAFWAARIAARFSDEAIHAVVARARYSEPGAAEYAAKTLIERRDKVLRAWLPAVNPIVSPAIDASGTLTFENAAVDAGVATRPEGYVVQWHHFDNGAGPGEAIGGEVRVSDPRAVAPLERAQGREFVGVTIRTLHPEFPQWADPVTVYFRRDGGGWRPVGLERKEPHSQ
ncbi:MAG TPA: hypothetical protein VK911_00790 [Vicinamibacterales bacterium]|nr:hypothetical protein [Vicinamibacterales bacterium]